MRCCLILDNRRGRRGLGGGGRFSRAVWGWGVVVALGVVATGPVAAQQRGAPIGVPKPPLGVGPFVFDTAEQHKIRVVVVARGIAQPWSLAFLPDGRMLVT